MHLFFCSPAFRRARPLFRGPQASFAQFQSKHSNQKFEPDSTAENRTNSAPHHSHLPSAPMNSSVLTSPRLGNSAQRILASLQPAMPSKQSSFKRCALPKMKARLCALSIITCLAFNAAADAQTAFWASTTADGMLGASGVATDDSSILRLESGQPARIQFGPEHWFASAGFQPSDIDAMGRRPGFAAASHGGLVFSLLSNEGGFLDGDVLSIAVGGGLELVVAEGDLVLALGLPSGGIDLDALAYDGSGRLLFSLQNNHSDSVVGAIDDGDVLRLEPGGSITRVMTESEVQADVTAATGSSAAITDVLALEFVAGDVWACVQSPSANDGSVIRCGATPAIMLNEADAGMNGAELDALLFLDAGWDVGRLQLSSHSATPGDVLLADFSGGEPGALKLIFAAGASGYGDTSFWPGYGGLFVDLFDPFLVTLFNQGAPIVALDGSGSLQRSLQLPAASMGGLGFGGEMGWTFQLLDVVTQEVSAPVRVIF